jgi:hypothetical protein
MRTTIKIWNEYQDNSMKILFSNSHLLFCKKFINNLDEFIITTSHSFGLQDLIKNRPVYLICTYKKTTFLVRLSYSWNLKLQRFICRSHTACPKNKPNQLIKDPDLNVLEWHEEEQNTTNNTHFWRSVHSFIWCERLAWLSFTMCWSSFSWRLNFSCSFIFWVNWSLYNKQKCYYKEHLNKTVTNMKQYYMHNAHFLGVVTLITWLYYCLEGKWNR